MLPDCAIGAEDIRRQKQLEHAREIQKQIEEKAAAKKQKEEEQRRLDMEERLRVEKVLT